MSGPVVNVVFGVDTGYARQLGITLRSLERNGRRGTVRAFVLHDGVPKAVQDQVEKALRTGRVSLEWIRIPDQDTPAFAVHLKHSSRATYFRLRIPDLLPANVRRAIYLDTDLIVRGDIADLWSHHLAGHALGAVVDGWQCPKTFAAQQDLSAGGHYFNAGVLMLDLDRLRREGHFARALDLLSQRSFRFDDQDVLNICFWKDWRPLPPAWNFQRNFLYDDFATWRAATSEAPRPEIVHFTDSLKPWLRTDWHPFAWLYLREARRVHGANAMLRAGGVGPATRLRWRLRWLKWNLRQALTWKAAPAGT